MTRPIKFRAWDKTNNRMSIVTNLAFGNDGSGKTLMVNVEDPQYSLRVHTEHCELMQFTGLLDKNGKEIYEGDIFNCIYHRDGHTDHRYYVIYNELWTCFDYQRIGKPCPQNQVNQSVRDGARLEIIGNVFESPELISVSDESKDSESAPHS